MRINTFFRINILILFLFPFRMIAEIPSDQELKFSIITCEPRQEVYAIFGHSALRMKNAGTKRDWVFNWGVFSMLQDNFILNFALGNTDYMLGVNEYRHFILEYETYGQKVTEQVLDLSPAEAQKLYDLVIENYRPENRVYRYNFIYDNCATRIRDLIVEATSDSLVFPDFGTRTYRSELRPYLSRMPFLKLGVELIFGAEADLQVSNFGQMFLPDYMFDGFGLCKRVQNGESLVKETNILNNSDINKLPNPYISILFFGVLFILVFVFTIFFRLKFLFRIFDILWLELTGLAGVFVLFFTFISSHPAMGENLNFLWLMPLNILAPFLLLISNKKPYRIFWIFIGALNLMYLLVSVFLLQQIPLEGYFIMSVTLTRALPHFKIKK